MSDIKKSVDKEASRVEGMLGYYPNIYNPSSYSEKILWRKFFDHNELFTITSDKVQVKEFLVEKFGESFKKYIIPTICSTNDPNKLPFDNLIFPCIIKANNGSGTNIILEDNNFNKDEIINTCKNWLNKKYGQKKFEWGYKNIQPKILIEPIININNEKLYDYRFFVFHGEIKIIQVDRRGSLDKKRNIYNKDFERIDLTIKYPNYDFEFIEPKNFNEMKSVATKIGSLFDFVRVDLYNIDGKIYFGETTHYPGSGAHKFNPKEFDFELGKFWNINGNNTI